MDSKLVFIILLAVSLQRLSLALHIGGQTTVGTVPPISLPPIHLPPIHIPPIHLPPIGKDPSHSGGISHPPAPLLDPYNESHPIHIGKGFNPVGVGPQVPPGPFEHFKDDQVAEIAHYRILQLKNLESNMITKENAKEWKGIRESYKALKPEQKKALETYFDDVVIRPEERERLEGIRWSLKRKLPVWWGMDFIEKSQGQYQELIHIGDLLKFNSRKKLQRRYIIKTIGPALIKILPKKPNKKSLNLAVLTKFETNDGVLIYHQRVTEVLHALKKHYHFSSTDTKGAEEVETSPKEFLELLNRICQP